MCCDFFIIICLCEGMLRLKFQPGTKSGGKEIFFPPENIWGKSLTFDHSALSPPVRRDYWENMEVLRSSVNL